MGKYNFSDAYIKFNGLNNKFKIPCLKNFIKLNPGIYYNNALNEYKG
jgi:hypothetical protein